MDKNVISVLVTFMILLVAFLYYARLLDGVLLLQSLGLAGITVTALLEIFRRIKKATEED